MIPNRFVILWDDMPVGLDHTAEPFKTDSPDRIYFWFRRDNAERYITEVQNKSSYELYSHMKVVEIQFRIMDS